MHGSLRQIKTKLAQLLVRSGPSNFSVAESRRDQADVYHRSQEESRKTSRDTKYMPAQTSWGNTDIPEPANSAPRAERN